MRSRPVLQLSAALGFLLLPLCISAQDFTVSAVVSGTITDSSGGVLPGVTVRAVHEATGNSFEAVTDELGAYRLAARPGVVRVTAEIGRAHV